jgi:hypothetical protein
MKPKEKAKELVNKYMFFKNNDDSIRFARRCALIAVDEILWMASHYVTIQYWNEVKQEIEKL